MQRCADCERVSVSLSWLFAAAECVGAAVEAEGRSGIDRGETRGCGDAELADE